MTWGWLVIAGLLFLCGVLLGYKWSWMDAYSKGCRDAVEPFKPVSFEGPW